MCRQKLGGTVKTERVSEGKTQVSIEGRRRVDDVTEGGTGLQSHKNLL